MQGSFQTNKPFQEIFKSFFGRLPLWQLTNLVALAAVAVQESSSVDLSFTGQVGTSLTVY